MLPSGWVLILKVELECGLPLGNLCSQTRLGGVFVLGGQQALGWRKWLCIGVVGSFVKLWCWRSDFMLRDANAVAAWNCAIVVGKSGELERTTSIRGARGRYALRAPGRKDNLRALHRLSFVGHRANHWHAGRAIIVPTRAGTSRYK